MSSSKSRSICLLTVDGVLTLLDDVFCGRDVVGVEEGEEEAFCIGFVSGGGRGPGERSETSEEIIIVGADQGEGRTPVITSSMKVSSSKSITASYC